MRRRLAGAARLLAVAIGVLFLCYVTARLLLAYQVRRGSQMLNKIQSVNVGDSEDSIRPLLERFGGHRWDVQLGAHEDYNYVLETNPWRFPTLWGSKSGVIADATGRGLSSRFRRDIGLRIWIVASEIAIKQHRVVGVQAETVVEGSRMWLGAMWRLSEKPREFERDAASLDFSSDDRQHLVETGILDMKSGSGDAWRIWFAPSSAKGQRHMASQLDFGCLRSLSGCDSVCDLMPEAVRFFGEHPDLAPKGGGWDEGSQTCIKHDLRETWYR